LRLVHLGFARVTILTNSERHFEAMSALRGCDPKRPITFPVLGCKSRQFSASPLLFAYVLSFHRNHRSAKGATLGNGGWLTPYHVRTFTRPDTPRFALRTNTELTGGFDKSCLTMILPRTLKKHLQRAIAVRSSVLFCFFKA